MATARASWVEVPEGCDFSLQNLPFGVFSLAVDPRDARCASALGEQAVDLRACHEAGLLNDLGFDASVLCDRTLNRFMQLSRPCWVAVRERLTELLAEDGADARLRESDQLRAAVLVPLAEVRMHLPATVGDYTDFYSSREHATNVGIMFRGVDNALQPNWLHLPVGYHGRASTVVVSGTDVVRPRGQLQADKDDPKKGSVYGPCRLLDYELEMGAFIGGPTTPMGRPITMEEAEDRIFGVVLMNDWSARDIQKWEYVPLGPFTAKNFATTISPWIITLEALEPYRCSSSAGVQEDPTPLEYIADPDYARDAYDVQLEVALQPPAPEGSGDSAPASVITRSNFRNLYWNMKQQLVHHTVTGCSFRAGDLLGSGTISGSDDAALGSMLELCWKGTREIPLEGGDVRKFIKDGDTIIMRGFCQNEDGSGRIGFGDCSGKVLPAGAYDDLSLDDAVPPPAANIGDEYSNFRLASYWRSTCSWRVRIGLALKGVAYEYEAVNLVKDGGEQKTAEFAERNAMKQLPVLQFEDGAGETHRLAQSMAILEFLDEAFPHRGHPLLPSHPLQRAQARRVAEIVNAGIQPLQNLSVFKNIQTATIDGEEGDGRAFAKAAIAKGLAALEQLLAPNNTRFCVSDSITIADIFMVPQLYNGTRFEVDLTAFPTLQRIAAECENHPAFVAAHPNNQPDAVENA